MQSEQRSKPPSLEDLNAATQKLEENADLLVSSNDSEIIRQTLRVYGSLFLAFFIIFCYLRRKFPKLYNIRSWVPELKSRLAITQSYGFFSWSWQVFKVNDDDLLQFCGMDATCFLRCLRLGAKLSAVGCFNAIWLIPLFYTAGGLVELNEEDRFVLMSVANLHSGSVRFAGVVVAAYIIVLTSLYLLSKEYNWYITYRHKFLSERNPRNFAIYVAGIPESLRSDYALADFFQGSQWKSSVLEANVAMNIDKLEAKVSKREAVIEKLEHAMAEEKLKGKVKKHRTFRVQNATKDIRQVSQSVESVGAYRRELDELNKKISVEIGKVRNSNHRLRRHLTKQKSDADVLRGRLLTPAPEETQAILDEVTHDLSESTSMNTMDAEEWPQSFRYRDSKLSLMGTSSIITDEMPEDEPYVPEVDFDSLPVVMSNSHEDDDDHEEDGIDEKNPTTDPADEKDTKDESTTPMNSDHQSQIEHDKDGNGVDDGEEFVDLENPQLETTSKPMETVDSSREEEGGEENEDKQDHPFLQLVGMRGLQEIGGSARLSVHSSLGDLNDDPDDNSEGNPVDDMADPEHVDLESGNAGDYIEGAASYVESGGSLDSSENTEKDKVDKKEPTVADTQLEGTTEQFESLRDSREPSDSLNRDSDSNHSRRGLTSQTSEISMRSGSNGSVSSSSGFKSRASSSIRHINNIRGSIASSVRVEHVTDSVKKARDLGISGSKKVRDLGVKGSKIVSDIGVKGSKTVRDSTIKATHGAKKAAEFSLKHAHHQLTENAAALAPMLRLGGEGSPRTAGFVVFKDHYGTQAALQMLQHPAGKSLINFVLFWMIIFASICVSLTTCF